MPPEWVRESQLLEGAWAAGTLGVFLLLGLILSFAMRFIGHRLDARDSQSATADVLLGLSGPLFLAFVLQGLFLALHALSQLSESIVTNYYNPTRELAVIVRGGVSYESDLTRVEQIAREVARGVIDDLPEGASHLEPWFGYDRIGESNVEFWVWVHATDRLASFRVTSELIRRLHGRLREEGIVVNHPVRKVLFAEPNGNRPQDALGPPSVSRDDQAGSNGGRGS